MLSHDELFAKVRAWVDRLPRQLRCPACDDHHWELRSLEETLGTSPAPDQVPPVVTIMCTCCGHLSFFESKAMGLKA